MQPVAKINTFNSKIFRCYLVLLILFSNVKVNQMVISNETRNREAQFSRNCIMEKSCFRYFKIYMIKFHNYNTEKINRKKNKITPPCEHHFHASP